MNTNMGGTVNTSTMAIYELVGKVSSNGNVTVYQVLGLMDGKLYNINRETMVKAAASGMVRNARVQEYNGVNILRGVGVNINDLRPIIPQRYVAAIRRGRTVREALADARQRPTKAEQEAKARRQQQQATRQQRQPQQNLGPEYGHNRGFGW